MDEGARATWPEWEQETVRRLEEGFPEAVVSASFQFGELTVVVAREAVREICAFLRNDPELRFDHLSDIAGVDYLKLDDGPHFGVVYHLYSLQTGRRLRLRVRIGEGELVPSVVSVWPAANFPEREVYDMFGVGFEGHPDLRRILMPDTWQGHPLRKDYPLTIEEVEFSFSVGKVKQQQREGY
ncbi:MAG: NADH-quinone oxidoreductase subunit C [Chloroflexota bacterium]|nr:MAG: NADH-quinone oxidoreductase subunit C [Chloroflexota bacterium]